MVGPLARRLEKEFADIRDDSDSGVAVAVVDANMTHLRGSFRGPPDTPYEDGTYEIDIRVPSEYPFKPPQMLFLTKIWHPNICSQTGEICTNTLGSGWSPVLTIKKALLNLRSLLSNPELQNPEDAEAASMLYFNPAQFRCEAREWAIMYARAPRHPSGRSKTGAGSPREEQAQREKANEEMQRAVYDGYNKNMIDRFTNMGFQVEKVVSAFQFVGIDRNGGEEYELQEAYVGDITATLFDEG